MAKKLTEKEIVRLNTDDFIKWQYKEIFQEYKKLGKHSSKKFYINIDKLSQLMVPVFYQNIGDLKEVLALWYDYISDDKEAFIYFKLACKHILV